MVGQQIRLRGGRAEADNDDAVGGVMEEGDLGVGRGSGEEEGQTNRPVGPDLARVASRAAAGMRAVARRTRWPTRSPLVAREKTSKGWWGGGRRGRRRCFRDRGPWAASAQEEAHRSSISMDTRTVSVVVVRRRTVEVAEDVLLLVGEGGWPGRWRLAAAAEV